MRSRRGGSRDLPLPRRSRVGFEVNPATYKTIALSSISGLRSMAAPALLARAVRRGELDAPNLPALGSREASALLTLLAIGEMIADKTPFIPSRTSPLALLGRALSGGLVGATLFASEGRRQTSGGVLGALCAAITARAGESIREAGSERLGLPDTVLALLEDSIVILVGTRVLRSRS